MGMVPAAKPPPPAGFCVYLASDSNSRTLGDGPTPHRLSGRRNCPQTRVGTVLLVARSPKHRFVRLLAGVALGSGALESQVGQGGPGHGCPAIKGPGGRSGGPRSRPQL